MIRRRVHFLAVMLAASVGLWAQKPGGGGTTGGTGTGTGGAGTGTGTGTATGNTRTPFPSTQTNPGMGSFILISGRVVLSDGTPPQDSAMIESICGPEIRALGYSENKGRFNVQFGKSDPTAMDASLAGVGAITATGQTNTGMTTNPAALSGCDLIAVLPGFQSDHIHLASLRSLDNLDVGTIVLHRQAGVEAATISATSLEAPKNASKAYEKAADAIRKQKWDEAEKYFTKAVEIYPGYAAAWYQLGLLEETQGDADAAKNSFAKAIEADPKLPAPYVHLAEMAYRERQWQTAADYSKRLIGLDGSAFPAAYLCLSGANYELKKWDAAERSALEGIRADKARQVPKLNHVLGLALAQKGDYAGAVEHLKAYLAADPNSPYAQQVSQQIAHIEGIAKNQAELPR